MVAHKANPQGPQLSVVDQISLPAPLVSRDVKLNYPYFSTYAARELKSKIMVATRGSDDPFRAAYRLKLWAWMEDPKGSLPDDDRELMYLAEYPGTAESWISVKEKIMQEFILCKDGRWYHESLADHANECWKSKEARILEGKKAAEKKKEKARQKSKEEAEDTSKNKVASRLPEGDHEVTLTKERRGEDRTGVSKKQTNTPPHTPPGSGGCDLEEEFGEFWERYPQREGPNPKEVAKSAYIQVRQNYAREAIMAGLTRYVQFLDAKGKAGSKYVKMAKNFLLGDGFLQPWEIAEGKPAAAAVRHDMSRFPAREPPGEEDMVFIRDGTKSNEDFSRLMREDPVFAKAAKASKVSSAEDLATKKTGFTSAYGYELMVSKEEGEEGPNQAPRRASPFA